MAWTQFHDMHSGGGLKEKFHHAFIEAPIKEAKVIFFNRFGHSPDRVSCTCCGEDYSLTESETLEQATGFERGCRWDKNGDCYVDEPDDGEHVWSKYMSLAEYRKCNDVCVITAADIKDEERTGDVPQEGYVWV